MYLVAPTIKLYKKFFQLIQRLNITNQGNSKIPGHDRDGTAQN